MKHHFLTWLAAAALASTSPAQIVESYSASPNLTIPDSDLVGVASTILVNGSSIQQITGLQVTLNITGGFNGDYFAYLVHTATGGGNAGFVTLLNRVGVSGSELSGYGDPGLSVTFLAGANDIHLYQAITGSLGSALTGIWSPDGRTENPLTATDTSPRDSSLASFSGFAANGTWTLYVSDLAGGDEGRFVSWGMQIVGVPEPGTWALGALGLLAVLGGRWRRDRPARCGP